MSSLSEILRTKLIPWSEDNARERFIVAQPKMCQADMPYGVQLVPHKIQSKRISVKNQRVYANVRNIIAEWPDAGLHEVGKYTLICTLDGHLDYQVGHYKVQCGSGYIIFIPPGLPCPDGTRHYVDLQKSTFCYSIAFLLHPHSLEYWTSHRTVQQSKRSDCGLITHERVVSIFEALMKEVTGGESKSLKIGESLLSAFFNLLQREVDAGNFQSYRSITNLDIEVVKTSSGNFLEHLENYVQTNLRASLTLDSAAAEMYFSRAQFARIMRRETGKSFNEFLAERRLEEAKRLLLNSQWTVNSIASLIGFKSACYFRIFFKKHVGLTPTEFRQRGLKLQGTKKH